MFWPNMSSFTGEGATYPPTVTHYADDTGDLQPFLATPQDVCLQIVLTAIYESFQTCWVFLMWKEEHQNLFILSSWLRGDCLDAETININSDEREVRDEMDKERIESVKDCNVWRPIQARNCRSLQATAHSPASPSSSQQQLVQTEKINRRISIFEAL